jgi:hypothetical protein
VEEDSADQMQQNRRARRAGWREKGEDQERRAEQRRGERDEGMRGIIVVLYIPLVDVYVRGMKTVALETPGSACAKRKSIYVHLLLRFLVRVRCSPLHVPSKPYQFSIAKS